MVACKRQVTDGACVQADTGRDPDPEGGGMQVLEAMQDAIGAAATTVGPSVVGLGRGWGRGSGVVVAPGRVLTNTHVLRGEYVGVTFAVCPVEHWRPLPGRPH